jgi:hypothetical protein
MPVSSGFWPDDIRPKIQTPLAILRARAIELNDLTKGTLIGSVSTTTDMVKKQTYHSLDVTVPVLRNLRQRLFTIRHGIDMVYPVYIDADLCGRFSEVELMQIGVRGSIFLVESNEYEASTDIQLIAFLKRALHSANVKSKLVSLIAIANQAEEQSEVDSLESPIGETGNQDIEKETPVLDQS